MPDNAKVQQRLRSWALQGCPNQPGTLSVVVLRHMVDNENARPVGGWAIEAGVDVRAVANAMCDKMQEEADNLKGSERFVIAAYFGDAKPGQSPPGDTFSQRADPVIVDSDVVGNSESRGTAKGLLDTAHRHIENRERNTNGMIAELFRVQGRMIDKLVEKLDNSEKNQEKVIELTTQLMDKTHMRNIEIIKVQQEGAIRKVMFEKAITLAPVALAKVSEYFMGKTAALPPGPTPPKPEEKPAPSRDEEVVMRGRRLLTGIGSDNKRLASFGSIFAGKMEVLVVFQQLAETTDPVMQRELLRTFVDRMEKAEYDKVLAMLNKLEEDDFKYIVEWAMDENEKIQSQVDGKVPVDPATEAKTQTESSTAQGA